MTAEQIYSLVAHPETEHLEMKRARFEIPEAFWETYSSFANTDGGVILLGVAQSGNTFAIEGVEDADHLKKVIWDTLNNPDKVSANILFNRNIYIVDCSGKRVVVIEVPRAARTDRPLYIGSDVFRGTYRRNGEGDYLCTREAVEEMIRDRGSSSADQTVLSNLLISDLDADTIHRYRRDFATNKPHHHWNDYPDEEFLLKIGAVGRAEDRSLHPNIAGLVCFGDYATILSQLPNFFLDYREKRSDDERWSDRVCSSDATWSGNVIDFFYRLYDRIVADVKVPFALKPDGIHREDETEMHKSIREVLANALIHADYHGRQGIVVERRFREIIIANPGTMRIPREEAIEGGRSDPRNSSIFNIFSLINVGDRSGTGLCDHYARWKRYGLPEPLLTESYDPSRTTLSFTFSLPEKSEVKTEEGREKAEGTKVKVPDAKVKDGETKVKPSETKVKISELTASAHQILAALREDPSMTYNGLVERFGFSTATIAKAISQLITNGLIVREGGRKSGHWKIIHKP